MLYYMNKIATLIELHYANETVTLMKVHCLIYVTMHVLLSSKPT